MLASTSNRLAWRWADGCIPGGKHSQVDSTAHTLGGTAGAGSRPTRLVEDMHTWLGTPEWVAADTGASSCADERSIVGETDRRVVVVRPAALQVVRGILAVACRPALPLS